MMVKKLLFIFTVLVTALVSAQDIDRVLIDGKITAPSGEDLEGITVYNISSQKGTITTASGEFEIEVGENDRLLINALQFQSFTVIVEEGILKTGKISIFLNPAMNQLAEVIVRPYDLSGNIRVDVNRIKTYAPLELDLSYETLEFEYDFAPDAQTAIRGNAAEEALNSNALKNGINFVSILGGLASLIVPKATFKYGVEEKQAFATNLKQRFSPEFISKTFDIPEGKAIDFLYFVEENGMDPDLLKPENEMLLMEVLLQQSLIYKQKLEEK